MVSFISYHTGRLTVVFGFIALPAPKVSPCPQGESPEIVLGSPQDLSRSPHILIDSSISVAPLFEHFVLLSDCERPTIHMAPQVIPCHGLKSQVTQVNLGSAQLTSLVGICEKQGVWSVVI